jgi:hypothetical protein
MNWNDKKRRLIESFYSNLSSDDRIEWATHRKACDKSSFFFIREVGGWQPKSGGDISPLIHKPILDRWQDKTITRQACYMPRSWKKSTCLTQWSSLWEYLQNNEIRILIPTEREEKASEWVQWIESQVILNERLRWLYPELTAVDESYTRRHRWSGKKFDLPRQGVYPEATVSIIGIRGGAQGGHYDLINGDDLVGEKGMESLPVLEDAERWFDNCEGLLIEKDPNLPDSSRVRLVGTHWARGDMGHYVQKEYPQYKWMIVPCLKDNTLKDTDNITWVQHPEAANGESNWPEMFATEVYTEMMANPQQEGTFWSQYMNNPRVSPVNPFDTAWLKYYDLVTRDGKQYIVCDDKEEFRIGSFPIYGFIDPGGFSLKKSTKNPSRFAILMGGQPTGSTKKFVLYTKAFRFQDPDKAKDEVFKANEYFKPVYPYLWRQECYGQQRYLLMDIKKEAAKRKVPLRLVELEADVNKDSKALSIDALRQPMFSGEIYVHRSMRDLISEINNYGSPVPVDLFDLLSQINKAYWKRHDPPKDAKLLTIRQVAPDLGKSVVGRTGY